MSADPRDHIHKEELSNCCGAPRLDPDFCFECGEHAEFEAAEEDGPTDAQVEAASDPRNAALTPTENHQLNDEHRVP